MIRTSARRWNFFYNCLQYVIDPDPIFCGNQRCVLGFNSNHILNLVFNPFRICTWQIDLVDHRKNLEIMIQCQIYICQCLRFNSLSRIHHKNCPVAGRKASADLIIEIHMSRRIY